MAIGGGKYGPQVEQLIRETNAQLGVAIVVGGTNGTGFSVGTKDLSLIASLPEILREVAASIERDLKNAKKARPSSDK